MIIDNWNSCYRKGWNGTLVPEAFAHPAKVSFGLAERIYQHLFEEGWLHAGDLVVDPFGGIGGCGFHAALRGCTWVGCELEARFVALGQKNIEKWRGEYSKLPGYGRILLLQGDSRKLIQVVSQHTERAESSVSSPPYNLPMSQDHNGSRGGTRGITPSESGAFARYGGTPGQLEGLPSGDFESVVSSPPYADGCTHTGGDTPTSSEHIDGGKINLPGISGVISSPPYSEARIGQESGQEHCGRGDQYGPTSGQLGAMDASGFEAAISSPPCSESNQDYKDGWKYIDKDKLPHNRYSKNREAEYGETSEQLGDMETGNFEGAVSSPPFENSLDRGVVDKDLRREYAREQGISNAEYISPIDLDKHREQEYGSTAGNIGNDTGETFWSAARAIVEQTYILLKPGAHAIWIVKSFVKDKQIVPFPEQWRLLCEAVGFITLHEHHAMLVEEKGTQITLDGEHITKVIKRASFFRRLAEKRGSPAIDWEVVYCMMKPEATQ